MWAIGLRSSYHLGGLPGGGHGDKSGYIPPSFWGGGGYVGKSATLPSWGSPSGDKIKNGYITYTMLWAHMWTCGHMWGKWLHNPCHLGCPRRGDDNKTAHITPAIFGAKISTNCLAASLGAP